ADPRAVELAGARAAIAVGGVVVVALLLVLDDAVATLGSQGTQHREVEEGGGAPVALADADQLSIGCAREPMGVVAASSDPNVRHPPDAEGRIGSPVGVKPQQVIEPCARSEDDYAPFGLQDHVAAEARRGWCGDDLAARAEARVERAVGKESEEH